MKIGVRIPGAGTHAGPENIATVAGWAEQLGFHSVWVSDHVVLPRQVDSSYPYDSENQWRAPANTPWIDPLLALAWAGAAAPSVQLGTSVLVLPLRNPVLLAKQLASLDLLSGGRTILGAGVGWMQEEFDLVGVPFSRRGARSVEMVQLMRAFWAAEPVDFYGEFYQLSNCLMSPAPVQRPIPVVWGGHSTYALKRAAQFGDGWHPTLISMAQLAEGVAQLRQFPRSLTLNG